MDRKLLEKQFDEKFVQKIQGFDYIAIHAVIQRLNDSLEPMGWSFVMDQDRIVGEEILIFGTLIVRDGDVIVSKSQVGSKKIAYYKGKDHVSENVVDLGNDYKSAVSDCIKKCATLLGVGLYLYGEVEEDPFTTTMAKIQRGEEELSKNLETTADKLRGEFFDDSVARPVDLTALMLGNLEGYLVFLRKKRDTQPDQQPKSGAQEQRKSDTGKDTQKGAGQTVMGAIASREKILVEKYGKDLDELRIEAVGTAVLDVVGEPELRKYMKDLRDLINVEAMANNPDDIPDEM